jgi:hypothetical protein
MGTIKSDEFNNRCLLAFQLFFSFSFRVYLEKNPIFLDRKYFEQNKPSHGYLCLGIKELELHPVYWNVYIIIKIKKKKFLINLFQNYHRNIYFRSLSLTF